MYVKYLKNRYEALALEEDNEQEFEKEMKLHSIKYSEDKNIKTYNIDQMSIDAMIDKINEYKEQDSIIERFECSDNDSINTHDSLVIIEDGCEILDLLKNKEVK